MITSKVTIAQWAGSICPCGQQIVFEIEKFNFRKPRTDCRKGFGLCLKLDKIYIVCSPCEGGRPVNPELRDDMVKGYVKASCGELSIHLPASLADDKMFEGESMSEFEIDDNAIRLGDGKSGPTYSIIGGIYPVQMIGDELVINVNYK